MHGVDNASDTNHRQRIEQIRTDHITQGKVVLYSTTWCGYCKKARDYFLDQGIAFSEYDVEKSTRGRRDYARLGGKSVPIILVGKTRINGFSVAQTAEC